jgi:hypothetical protein
MDMNDNRGPMPPAHPIRKGDKPDGNQFSALALQWCEEWYGRMQAAFGQKESA